MQTTVPVRSAQRRIPAPADRIFRLLAHPEEHHRFDASAMVGRAVTPGRLTAVGAVFTMQMTYSDGAVTEHYRSDNHVTVFRPDRCLEWTVATEGGEPLGWRWRYDLEPGAAGPTLVTLTYDWTGTPGPIRRRFGVPLLDEQQLAASLALLDLAVRDR